MALKFNPTTGLLDIDTTLTSSMFLLKAPDDNADNLITQQSATDITFLSLDPIDADAKKFNWILWTSAQSGRDNVGVMWGYNQASGGGVSDSADNSFYISMETHYNPAADPLMEYHLNAYTADGLTSKRPFHINVYKDDLFTEFSYTVDSMSWLSRTNGYQGLRLDLSTNAATSQWIMYVPPIVRGNSTSMFLVQNLATTQNYFTVDTVNGHTYMYGIYSVEKLASAGTFATVDAGSEYFAVNGATTLGYFNIKATSDKRHLVFQENAGQTAAVITDYDSSSIPRWYLSPGGIVTHVNAANTRSITIYTDGTGYFNSNSTSQNLYFNNWGTIVLGNQGWVIYAADTTATTRLAITAPSAASIPLTITSAASPSVNQFVIENSGGSDRVWVDSAYGVHINNISTVISDNPSLEVVNYNSSTGSKELIYANLTLTGSSAAGSQFAIYSLASDGRSSGNVGVLDALYFQAAKSSTGTVTSMSGVDGLVTNSGTGSITTMVALGATSSSSANASITSISGVSYSHSQSNGTITNLYGLNIGAMTKSGGTVTNEYGVYVSDINIGGTLNYAVYTNAGNNLFNAGGDASSDFTIKSDSYDAFFVDASDNATYVMNHASGKISFFAVTAVTRQTELTDELTTITFTAPGTPDYAIQNLTNAGGYGFVTQDEGNTVLSVIANLQARVNELETKLTAYGLLQDAD